jgi:hypothetical protein
MKRLNVCAFLCACASHVKVTIRLSPLKVIPLPKHSMNLALGETTERQEGGGFNTLLDLLPRPLDVRLALALADEGPL